MQFSKLNHTIKTFTKCGARCDTRVAEITSWDTCLQPWRRGMQKTFWWEHREKKSSNSLQLQALEWRFVQGRTQTTWLLSAYLSGEMGLNYRLAELNKNTEIICAVLSCSSTKLDSCSGWRNAGGVERRAKKSWNGNHLNIGADRFMRDCGNLVCFSKPQLNKFPGPCGNISTCCSCQGARDKMLVMPKQCSSCTLSESLFYQCKCLPPKCVQSADLLGKGNL